MPTPRWMHRSLPYIHHEATSNRIDARDKGEVGRKLVENHGVFHKLAIVEIRSQLDSHLETMVPPERMVVKYSFIPQN
jgi:hypothetical protein